MSKRLTPDEIKAEFKSIRAAVREFCGDCHYAGRKMDALNCKQKDCNLWPYRTGCPEAHARYMRVWRENKAKGDKHE